MAARILGVSLVVIGLLLAVIAWLTATETTLDAEDAAYFGRVTLMLATGAAVSVLSGVLVLTRRK